MRLNMQVF